MAFIESAGRRYTKHSKDKAQEIQGAVLPIVEKHRFCAPFMGCILFGEYTGNAVEQLRSMDFRVLYKQHNTVLEAFKEVGVDAYFTESTPDDELGEKVRKWAAVPQDQRVKVWNKLVELNAAAVEEFMGHLERAVQRQIKSIRIIPLHEEAKGSFNSDSRLPPSSG